MNVAVASLGWWGKHIVRTLAESSKLDVVAAVDPTCTDDAKQFVQEAGITLVTDLSDVL